MKINDVVNQLQALLPKYTSLFSNVLNIASISVTATTATITTSNSYGFTTGDAVTIANVLLNTPIASVSQNGLLFTFTTSIDHDLTFVLDSSVTLNGFTDGAWNDSFVLTGVPNRTSFTVRSANTIPIFNSNEILEEMRRDGINGLWDITVINNTSFTITGTFVAGVYTGGTINTDIRIAGSITLERALEQYTKNNIGDFWAIVVMNDIDVSKDRNTLNDSVATRSAGVDMRQRILDGFTVTFVGNTSNDIAGTDTLDICRHDLFRPILKSILGAKFDSGLSENQKFKTVLTGAGIADGGYNRAILAYTYAFELPYDLTQDDGVEELDTRAFRDINYIGKMGDDDTTDMTVGVNLDESP
jgi:hypothetical protein